MEEESRKFTNYYLSTFINYLIFSNDDLDDEETLAIINDDMFLDVFSKKLNKNYIYPTSALNRIKKIIGKLNPNSKLVDLIKDEYNDISSSPSNDIYFDEIVTKFMKLKYMNEDELRIDRNLIENSIAFDYITLYSLIDKEVEIEKTPLYISSIKKFLYEFPSMFIDREINKRTIEILEKQESDEKDILLYKMKHIDKFQINRFSYQDFRFFYEFIKVQNMLIDSDLISIDNIKDSTVNTLFNMIDYKLIGDELSKRNALDIMYTYKEEKMNELTDSERKEFISEYNDHLGKLNCLTENKAINYIEQRVRTKGIFKQVKNVDECVKNDLDFLNYLIYDEELNLSPYELELTINKCLNMYPPMFENDEIYTKTLNCYVSKKQKNKIKNIYRR